MPALAADWSGSTGGDHHYSASPLKSHGLNRFKVMNGASHSSQLKSPLKTVNGYRNNHHQQNGHHQSNNVSTQSQHGAGDGPPQPKMVLYELKHVNVEWPSSIKRVGVGLSNLSNTCFLNSVLQCLLHTPPLAHYMSTPHHKKECRLSGFCMLCALSDLQNKSLSSVNCAVKPLTILQNLKQIAKTFVWGRQEDAHEFLRYVVDGMQKSSLSIAPSIDRASQETTVVHRIFGGYLRSQVKCQRCHHESNTYEPSLDMSVDIKGVDNLLRALHNFVQPETLDIENAYKCDKCHQKVRAQKRFTIHQAPNVLTVHLKRFDIDRMMGSKVTRHVQFPHKLDIRPYMSLTKGPPERYVIYAVLEHSGFSCNSGHYFSYVKSPSGNWHCMNDSTVTQTSWSVVQDSQAYILFYVRCAEDNGPNKTVLINGKPPHSQTKAEAMLSGAGDGATDQPLTWRMIGPQLPTAKEQSVQYKPTPIAFNLKTAIKPVSRMVVHRPKTGVSKHVGPSLKLPSLVSYDEEEESDTEQKAEKTGLGSQSNGGVEKKGKLSLSEYSARQEERHHEKQANADHSACTVTTNGHVGQLELRANDDVQLKLEGNLRKPLNPETAIHLSATSFSRSRPSSSVNTNPGSVSSSVSQKPVRSIQRRSRSHSRGHDDASRSRATSPRSRASSPRSRATSPRSRDTSPRPSDALHRSRLASPRSRATSPRPRLTRSRDTSPKSRAVSPRSRAASPRSRAVSSRERGHGKSDRRRRYYSPSPHRRRRSWSRDKYDRSLSPYRKRNHSRSPHKHYNHSRPTHRRWNQWSSYRYSPYKRHSRSPRKENGYLTSGKQSHDRRERSRSLSPKQRQQSMSPNYRKHSRSPENAARHSNNHHYHNASRNGHSSRDKHSPDKKHKHKKRKREDERPLLSDSSDCEWLEVTKSKISKTYSDKRPKGVKGKSSRTTWYCSPGASK